MQLGARTVVGVLALVLAFGGLLAPAISAQTEERAAGAGMLGGFGAGSGFGVSVRELTPAEVSRAKLDRPGGVYVLSVQQGGPAARSGIREGDVIVMVDGERVRGTRHFSRLVLESPTGRSVQTEIVRDTARQTVEVTPEASRRFALPIPEIREEMERIIRAMPPDFEMNLPAPPRFARARLGITMTPLTDQLAAYFGVKEGVLVSAVEAGSPAATAGLRAGDVITNIGERPVRSQADVLSAVREATPGAAIDIRLMRDKKNVDARLVVPERQPGRSTPTPI
jgi:serine protease Do